MNRHKFVYLFISLTLVAFVFGALPFAAAETSNVPAGVTETPTTAPTATNTSAPTATNTSVPMATNTSAPTATNTSVPMATNTSVPTNTPIPNTPIPNTPIPNTPIPNTPMGPAVVGLPNTGGAAPQGGASPWTLLLVAAVAGSLVVLAFGLSMRAHRPMRR